MSNDVWGMEKTAYNQQESLKPRVGKGYYVWKQPATKESEIYEYVLIMFAIAAWSNLDNEWFIRVSKFQSCIKSAQGAGSQQVHVQSIIRSSDVAKPYMSDTSKSEKKKETQGKSHTFRSL